MAKRSTTRRTPNKPAKVVVEAEHKLEVFAADLGRFLGHAQNKAESWLERRAPIVTRLETVRDGATQLLTQLGHTASETVRKVRRRRRPKKYVAPASNPAGGMKPVHRARKASPAGASRVPLPPRAQGRFPQARRAPK